MLCQVYTSSRQQEMYLYVEKSRGVEDVPAELLSRFGELIPVMLLPLSPERKLARADVNDVLACIEKQGFYLQMPPTMAELLARENGRG
ncbi:MAG: YcgL domain-containing protein [Halioglobus sp.]|nr:YcgL domain-containing protein [Halioglobus sp.]